MVLGFGSRSSRKKGKDEHVVRYSPSLPEMSTQGIPWPSNLVDVSAIRPPSTPEHAGRGAARVSFSSPDHSTIPFHKPFRMSPSKSVGSDGKPAGPIASLYMSHPPSSFADRAPTSHSHRTRHSSRRQRVAPTFNLMVAGAQGTGKSSLLRLLIDTADISPTATLDQRTSMDRFLRESGKRTEHIATAVIEICESRFDRILLSVIDTPGLDFQEGHELRLERQVSGIMKYLDLQYADTMDEESKVIRKSKGDQHVHLCIYLIDPDSVMTASARRALSSLPLNSRSEVLLAYRPPESPAGDALPIIDEQPLAEQDPLTMNPADIRVIRRLSNRVNVLPIIARADILTDEKLNAVKKAIRRDLYDAKLGFGIFGPAKLDETNIEKSAVDSGINGTESVSTNGGSNGRHLDEGFGSEESSEDERRARPIIKLNPTRRLSTRSTSRSRLEEMEDRREPLPPEMTDPESLASVRFSAHFFGQRQSISELMPFAVIMPEQTTRLRRALKASVSRPVSGYSTTESNGAPPTPISQKDTDPFAENERGTPTPTPTLKSPSTDHLPYLQGPPRDLKGVFVRRFRWGVVDVLDPIHCDYAALRTAVLSTHMKVLKLNTKEVLYEKYRTEKLLARRATRNISDDDRKRLLEDLGL